MGVFLGAAEELAGSGVERAPPRWSPPIPAGPRRSAEPPAPVTRPDDPAVPGIVFSPPRSRVGGEARRSAAAWRRASPMAFAPWAMGTAAPGRRQRRAPGAAAAWPWAPTAPAPRSSPTWRTSSGRRAVSRTRGSGSAASGTLGAAVTPARGVGTP